MYNVLILCTGNSCRSILGEALLNHLGKGRVKAFSAGSHPTGKVNPNAINTLQAHGISTDGFSSQSWDEFAANNIDIVISVCDSAGGETCPVFLNNALRAHWGLPDPAHVKGSDEEIKTAFESTYDALVRRINQMLELPLEKLSGQELVAKLNNIGKMDC